MSRERIWTLLRGVTAEHFRPALQRRHSQKLKCIAGGSWLRDRQALFETARLLRQGARIEFHVISSATDKPPDLDNVIVYNNISDEEYRRLFLDSDVLFMPLESATANNVALEGTAFGLPVVSTDLASLKVYLPDEGCFLVKGNNPAEFAAILTRLADDAGLGGRAAIHARRRTEELSWSNIIRRYENFYTQIVNDR